MPHSTANRSQTKPAKPYKDFPLFPHATKRWAKKIKGRTCYFGPWDDPDAALKKYLDQRDDLYAGRDPQTAKLGELTLADAANHFLTSKTMKVDSGELSVRSMRDYHKTCERVIQVFGRTRSVSSLGPNDFQRLRSELVKGKRKNNHSLLTLSGDITRVRMLFKYAVDSDLIDKPVRYGQSFDKPTRKALRVAKAKTGPQMFQAAEVHQLLEATNPIMRAMILTAINAGFGQTDISSLPLSAVDLDNAWLDFPRPKTGTDRRCKLWPETVEAIRRAIPLRPRTIAVADEDCVFLTTRANRWVRTSNIDDPRNANNIDSLAVMFRLLREAVGINNKRTFYDLRRTFATVASDSLDQVAVDFIMGHIDPSMSATYRQRISDERLIAVTDTVHNWLFPADEGGADSSLRTHLARLQVSDSGGH